MEARCRRNLECRRTTMPRRGTGARTPRSIAAIDVRRSKDPRIKPIADAAMTTAMTKGRESWDFALVDSNGNGQPRRGLR